MTGNTDESLGNQVLDDSPAVRIIEAAKKIAANPAALVLEQLAHDLGFSGATVKNAGDGKFRFQGVEFSPIATARIQSYLQKLGIESQNTSERRGNSSIGVLILKPDDEAMIGALLTVDSQKSAEAQQALVARSLEAKLARVTSQANDITRRAQTAPAVTQK